MKKIDITKKYTSRIGEDVQGLQWSPDGEQLVGWVKDKNSGEWEAATWNQYGRYFNDESVNDLIEVETEEDKWVALMGEWEIETKYSKSFGGWLRLNFKAPERLTEKPDVSTKN